MNSGSFDDMDWLAGLTTDDSGDDDLFESIMREISAEANSHRTGKAAPAEPEKEAPTAPVKKAPAPKPVPEKKKPAPKPVQEEPPVPEELPEEPKKAPKKSGKKKKKKRGPRIGSIIFYVLYFFGIAVAAAAIYFALVWLNGWLKDYQAAQPDVKSQQVFEQLFDSPDWASLYEMAGEQSTTYEGAAEYAAYMEQKIGSAKLDYVETSAGLSGDKKFIVRADGEKVATFTLEGAGKTVTDIPNWHLGQVEVFYTRTKGATFTFPAGCTVYVNDVPLGEEFTIESQSSFVSKYLSEPTILSKVDTQTISGFLVEPRVEIRDAEGNPVEAEYDPETNTYTVPYTAPAAMSAPEDARQAALNAAEAYAGFMINASGSGKAVARYFDTGANVYKQILSMNSELWMNSDRGHVFTEEQVSQYIPSGSEEFSIRVHVNMNVTCKDNTKKDYEVDTTMFFHKKSGSWVCYEMTNEEIGESSHVVRLTFKQDDAVLSSEFYETNTTEIHTPMVSVPNGKVFSGWVRQDIDEEGRTALTIVFEPDENGLVTLPAGNELRPQVLYPLFENA